MRTSLSEKEEVMAEEEKKVSSKRDKKTAVKKEKPAEAKQEVKQELKATVKKVEAKKEIVVGSIVSYKDRKFEVLSISNNFADLSLVDKPHKLFSLSLRKLTLVK
jgi:hypothetical protein